MEGDWRDQIQWWVRFVAEDLYFVRAALIEPRRVEAVEVVARGSRYPLKRLAVVASRAGRILVRPFDPANVPAVVEALGASRLSARPLDDRRVAVHVPMVEGPIRKEMVRQVKRVGRDAKSAIRSIRKKNQGRGAAAAGPDSARAVKIAAESAIGQIDRLVALKLHELGET